MGREALLKALSLLLLSFHFVDALSTILNRKDPDDGLGVVDIVHRRGYDIDMYNVTTEDGYILGMFRLLGNEGKPPVILQHGLLDSSYTWVCNYKDQSLAYILHDAGFDVWLGNNRGTTYSRTHVSKNPEDGTNDYWNFTWDDLAKYDVPAFIDFVTQKTNKPSVGWVGHSEGTIQMFGAAAQRLPSVSKVNVFVALAPVAYVAHQKSKEIKLLAHSNTLQDIMKHGMYEFLPSTHDPFYSTVCKTFDFTCDLFLLTVCGPTRNLNVSRIQVYVSQTPAGTSTTNMEHWQQGVLKDTFQMFDYGSDDANMAKYGSTVPPLYNLSQVSVPTALFTGGNDYLANPTDVKRLMAELPSETVVFHNNQEKYAHLDFTWGITSHEDIYPDVVSLLKKYSA